MKDTEELLDAVFGKGKGLAYEMVSMKTKLNVLITLNVLMFGGFITMAYNIITK